LHNSEKSATFAAGFLYQHPNMESKKGEIIIYQTEDARIDVRLENDTVWLTQAQMAELFQTDRTSIVRHINNIYKTDELTREATCAKIAQVQKAAISKHISIIFATGELEPTMIVSKMETVVNRGFRGHYDNSNI
jgi:hypothetical protein